MKIRKKSRRIGDKSAALIIRKDGKMSVVQPKDAPVKWSKNMITITAFAMLMEDPTRKHELQLVLDRGHESYSRYDIIERFFDPIYMGSMGEEMLRDAVEEFKTHFAAFTARITAFMDDGEENTRSLQVLKTINALLINRVGGW